MDRKSNTLTNFSSGEWSPDMAARTDLGNYAKSLSWCQNFVIMPQGGACYRAGSFNVGLTKLVQTGSLIPFQFSANDAIMIVATDSVFRYYRNNAVILNTAVNISAITQATPAQVTAAGHGLTTGQEVYISNVFGMSQVNGRFFLVTVIDANNFTITDQFGANVSSTAYNAYTSGGTVASIYETTTPYSVGDLLNLRYAQQGDVMYIVNGNYAPEKLVRSGFTNWALGTFARTTDPFTGTGVVVNPTGITNANPGVVTVASTTGMINGDTITIKHVLGMTQLNGNTYTIQGVTGTTFQLFDTSGNPVNTTHFGAYDSGGQIQDVNNWPSCVSFSSDARLVYAHSRQNPQGLWGSRLPNGVTTRFDDFTTGTSDNTFAYAYQFAPPDGIIDAIQELKQFGGQFALLGASSVTQVYGSASDQPPSPLSISTQITIQGCSRVMPVALNRSLLYVDVNGQLLREIQYDFSLGSYQDADLTEAATHFGQESPFIKIAKFKGQPRIIWVLRADGVLLSLTYDPNNKIVAWARHYVGGGGVVIDIASLRNANGNDQLWMIVQRTIGANTVYAVEVMSAWPKVPLRRAFFTNKANKASDELAWQQATWEQLKPTSFLDSALTFDGRNRGILNSATITPSATSGAGITINSSAACFQASDVGRQIWKAYTATGAGGGQAQITAVVSSTQVTATVLTPFDTTAAILPGNWEFAVKTIDNLQLYEGQAMNIQADGGAHPSETVTGGVINLQWYASIVQVGFKYTGMLVTQNLDPGSRIGTADSLPRNIKRIRPRFKDSIACQVGTSEYDLQKVVFRQSSQAANRVPPPFTGAHNEAYVDRWEDDLKQVVILNDDPTPCTVLALNVEGYVSETP